MSTGNGEVKTSRGTGLTSLLSFIAVCIGGVSLFVAMILKLFGLTADWIGTLQTVANAIGWFVLCLVSTKFLKRRRRLWTWIIWIIAVVMIISGIIVPLFA